MDLQRTLLIGAIAIVAVLILRQWYKDYNQIQEPTREDVIINNVGTSQNASDVPIIALSSTIPQIFDPTIQLSSQFISVTTDTLDLQIDLAGGDIISLSLQKYPLWLPEEGKKSKPFQLMVNKANCQENNTICFYIAQSALVNTDGPNDNNQRSLYSSKQNHYSMAEGQNQLIVDLVTTNGNIHITKRYTFKRNAYNFQVQYEIKNQGDTLWRDQFYAQLKRDQSKDPSLVNSSVPLSYLGAAVKSIDEPYVKLPFDNFVKNSFKEKVKGGYAAILQHYFISAWIPAQDEKHTYYTNVTGNKYVLIGFYDDPIEAKPGEIVSTGAILYAGPKNQENLKALAEGLQLTMDFGMLWFLAQPLFLLLKFIYSLVNNWGWSIILLTICVKAVFYPLNQASFSSMAKMRKLGPQMQKLKEQYSNDRQKMSQSMMELYKKEKVNPMGGCLTIFLQMPVFIALYWVLQESVELRQAPWLAWIHDLSQMDPYFILPLSMGVSMFAQQMLNPIPPDPIQAKVMKLIPIIFTIFFLWFPAGLVLYWVTNNILSIIQQYIITKKITKEA